ncbi:MAG TPA: acyl-CoA dehydrogenase family protein [Candidatus Eremiobacteraceae bacterium]
MSDATYLRWPFFEDSHRELSAGVEAWAERELGSGRDHGPDVDDACRDLVRKLGRAGWLRHCVTADHGGVGPSLDVRSICLIREILARHDALADFAFALQGLGSGAISLHGSALLRNKYLPPVCAGDAIAAFAISEAEAGSDVGSMTATARLEGDDYVIDGEKTWISNGGIAQFYVVFARTGEAPGSRGISAFVVDADAPGLTIAERIHVIAPHPLATLRFSGCRVPGAHLIGARGDGFKIAMQTLDIFRASVAAAALGMARRALDEAVARATARVMFGHTLADMQLTQTAIADMATGIDASALLTYRAAWTRDVLGKAGTREAAMAKMTATETAQSVIDHAVQIFGGLGVVRGNPVERLYREIRALRIYEGATEVQKLIVARETFRGHSESVVPAAGER